MGLAVMDLQFFAIFACRLQAGGSWIGIVIPSSLVPVLNHGSHC